MNLEKIKKMLKSKKGIVVSGLIVGAIVVGIIGGVLVNGSSKLNDIAKDNKPVIGNKKEDIKKDRDESTASKKENNNVEDKKEEMKENESNINMTENSTISNEIKNNNTNTNKNNVQSSSNNNSSNNNSSNNSNNSNNNATNNNASSGTTHTYSWNPITEQVHHDEVGHWEDVVVKPAWTESIPVYEDREFMICNDCGAELNASNCYDHVEEHLINGGKGSWREEWRQVQVGTNNVNHLAVKEKKWVVDKAAWTETVTVGHSCSCGATK